MSQFANFIGFLRARQAGINYIYAQLQFWFVVIGMYNPGAYYWLIAYGLKHGDASGDAEGLKTMQNLAKNKAWLLKKLESASK